MSACSVVHLPTPSRALSWWGSVVLDIRLPEVIVGLKVLPSLLLT